MTWSLLRPNQDFTIEFILLQKILKERFCAIVVNYYSYRLQRIDRAELREQVRKLEVYVEAVRANAISRNGQKLGPKEKPEGFTAMPGALMKSPFAFQQHGESGRWVSSVFPYQAKWVDEMAFLMACGRPTCTAPERI